MSQESEQAQEAWGVKAEAHEERRLQASGHHHGYGSAQDFLRGKEAIQAALRAEIEKRIKDSMKSHEDDFSTEEWFLSLLDTVTPIK